MRALPTTLAPLALLALAATPAACAAAAPGPAGEEESQRAELPRATERLESYLTRPLYLADEPPECRALERLRLRVDPGEERAAAFERAAALGRRWQAGAALDELVAEEPAGRSGEVLGSFPPGLLRADLEAFLWTARPGAVSAPLETPEGFELAHRIERWAGCRVILLEGDAERAAARARELLRRLAAGEDFAALAAECSDDPTSAARGGAWSIFERGPRDQALKGATFRARPGEVFGPLPSAAGLLVAQRVAPEALPEPLRSELREDQWVRARAIFVAHRDVGGSRQLTERTLEEAGLLAADLYARLLAGEDMAQLARRFDDDRGGRERAGDLGWLYRPSPGRSAVLDPLFGVPPGTLLEPLPIEAGWLLLRRER